MDAQPASSLAVIRAQPPEPGDDGRHLVGPVARRHIGAELYQRVAARVALPVPRPPAPDRDLELDHRLEPVDVGPLEQAGLDQTHGPGRIARSKG